MLCRNGIALEMSRDHKPEDEHELNRIHKAGGKVTCEGRVNGGLNLSRALGMWLELMQLSRSRFRWGWVTIATKRGNLTSSF